MRIRKAYIRTLTALLALALWLWAHPDRGGPGSGGGGSCAFGAEGPGGSAHGWGYGKDPVWKNQDQTLPMASTTKIMTCILALENASLDDVVEVSSYAASMPDVQLNSREGNSTGWGIFCIP